MYIHDATINTGEIFKETVGFEWDSGNKEKSSLKHGVGNEECEEVFFDPDKKVQRDTLHSQNEERYILLGRTKQSRVLYVAFTVRKERIRVISARDINKKELKLYEKEN